MNESLNSFLAAFRPIFVRALKTLLKVGGFKAWLVGILAKELYDEIGVPVVKAGLVELGYHYDKIQGRAMLKKIQGAQNDEEYDDAVDDVLGSRS